MKLLPRKVVAVSEDPDHAEFLEALMLDVNDRGVILMESVVHGSSRERSAFAEIIATLYASARRMLIRASPQCR